MNLALFDFDGTITHKDTFTAFIHFAVEPKRLAFGRLVLAPIILGYKLGVVPAGKARERVAGFGFKGCAIDALQRLGQDYAQRILPDCLRPEAMQRLQWHRAQGDTIAVVSASLDLYLGPWCEANRFDLICSQLELDGGRVTGKFRNGDCSGKEKARRINCDYDLSRYAEIFAYGDTVEDREMLALATVAYYRWRPFNGTCHTVW